MNAAHRERLLKSLDEQFGTRVSVTAEDPDTAADLLPLLYDELRLLARIFSMS